MLLVDRTHAIHKVLWPRKNARKSHNSGPITNTSQHRLLAFLSLVVPGIEAGLIAKIIWIPYRTVEFRVFLPKYGTWCSPTEITLNFYLVQPTLMPT